MTNQEQPDFLLFAQHGWADTGKDISRLANALATSKTIVIAPSLGLIKTFIRIESLVAKLEQIAAGIIEAHPHVPLKIMGHSMGGLMWLEVLDRHPQWWKKIHSLVLLGSPVGGSNVARAIDPLNLGIGSARDLGKNRRYLAETIARHIPTLSIASDIGMGTDGLVTVENTKFNFAHWVLVRDIPHHLLKCHPQLVPLIQNFWHDPQLKVAVANNVASQLVRRLQAVPGMTDTDYRHFKRSQIMVNLADGIALRTWQNPWGVYYVYLSQAEICLYAGYVGWLHYWELRQAIVKMEQLRGISGNKPK